MSIGGEDLYLGGVTLSTDEIVGLKRPEVLKALRDFQGYMLLDDSLGGA
jgi:hypothetical protein